MKEIGVVAFCRVSRQVWLGMASRRKVCRKVRVHLPDEDWGEFQAGTPSLELENKIKWQLFMYVEKSTYHICREVTVETKRASPTWECLVHVETRHWPLAKHSSEHILPIKGKTHTPAQWSLLHFHKITAFIPPTQWHSGCLTDQTCLQHFPWFLRSPKAQTFLLLSLFHFLYLLSLQIGWQFQKVSWSWLMTEHGCLESALPCRGRGRHEMKRECL